MHNVATVDSEVTAKHRGGRRRKRRHLHRRWPHHHHHPRRGGNSAAPAATPYTSIITITPEADGGGDTYSALGFKSTLNPAGGGTAGGDDCASAVAARARPRHALCFPGAGVGGHRWSPLLHPPTTNECCTIELRGKR